MAIPTERRVLWPRVPGIADLRRPITSTDPFTAATDALTCEPADAEFCAFTFPGIRTAVTTKAIKKARRRMIRPPCGLRRRQPGDRRSPRPVRLRRIRRQRRP